MKPRCGWNGECALVAVAFGEHWGKSFNICRKHMKAAKRHYDVYPLHRANPKKGRTR